MSRLFLAVLLTVAAVQPALALNHHDGNGSDRASFGSDITVGAEDTVSGDIACAFCSVHVHGDVKGDVAVLFGNVDLDTDHSISGDVAVLGGNVAVADDATIHGDLAIAAGHLNLSPNGVIHGGQTVLPGGYWLLAPFAPLLILIGFIWLIVWLVRRNRQPYPYPQQPRRF
jgi:predicted acyltransferase (DUF342 family)